MKLSMVFRRCLPGFDNGIARFEARDSHLVRIFNKVEIYARLHDAEINFLDDIFISDEQLIRGLDAVKNHKPSVLIHHWVA